ncbi:hypothetical protein B0H66DRAFT_549915 [Apodospora peruviana]|uniref:FAD-binding domain-containing protein n=1 Tax=Apodospora peruviana TaxID=516989 RepID=A0AAE0IJN1_9PEZI|nr:hypothetical protein B0H66DRAFT_549915 [Apodospora peruviana]
MRVVIVGSGLSGLIMGHCLHQAGIHDFVILERRPDPVERSGSVIGLFPQTFRILDQLDLLEGVQKLSPPLKDWIHLDPRGQTIYHGDFFALLEKNHGHPSTLAMRRELMEILYSRLPDREKRVIASKEVVGIEQDDSSVTVTCADGSAHTGDILVGCDGVRSAVRRSVMPEPPKSKAEYRGLFGSSPLPAGLAPACITETHNSGIVFMILCSQDRAFWLITNVKDKGESDSRKYSDQDIQALIVDKYQDHSVALDGNVTFGDLWRTRNVAGGGPGMYDYLEGFAERWYRQRVVLVGDAAHMMTPNLGQGGNNSIEDVASLVNQLHALLRDNPSPTTAELEGAFARYQKQREKQVKTIAGITGNYTRWTSWRNWVGWFMQFWMWPLVGDGFVVNWLLSPMIRESIKLDFVEEKRLRVGKVAWKYT